MANNKNYLEFLDIPDGNSTTRWHTRDVEAQANIAQVASTIGLEPIYVDLGLPSGTLWAKCNVGATKETEYGDYYKYGLGAEQYDNAQTDYAGTESPLSSSVDTATQVMGSLWHTPTQAQIQELINNTTYTWETNFYGSGIKGGKFTAANGKYIFLPAGGSVVDGSEYGKGSNGYCWTSSPLDNSAYSINFNNERVYINATLRKAGLSIRGVMDSNPYDITKKADKSELPTYATVATCESIIDELT